MEDALEVLKRELLADPNRLERFFSNFLESKTPKVYFLRCHEYVKIGTCSSDFHLRFSELQIGNPYSMVFEGAIPGGRDKERAIHNYLVKYWHRGEWFRITPEHCKEVIKMFLQTGKKQAIIEPIAPEHKGDPVHGKPKSIHRHKI